MKKLIRILIISSVLFSLTGLSVFAAPSDPPPPIFLPLITRGGGSFQVSGMVKDVDGNPVAHATVSNGGGIMTVTDLDGVYTLLLPAGTSTLTATRSGYDIAPLVVNVSGPMVGQDITALAGCGDVMVNGALSTGLGGWNFPVADVFGGHTTGGTDATVFLSAATSGRTGITAAMGIDVLSDSTAVSQVYHLPTDADMVLLGLWIYQQNSLVGTPGDQQYIQILDENDVVLDVLYSANLQNPVWTYYEFNLNSYIGQAIKIEIGTFNDGADGGGISSMYFDDVTLTQCTTDIGAGGCVNVVLNGTMEATGGWSFLAPQTIPPSYAATPVHAGAFSLQTGIPIGGVATASFSEAYQIFNIPANAVDAHLSFWYYTASSVTATNVPAMLPEELNAPYGSYPPAIDQQYIYLNPGEDDQYAKKYNADNNATWRHFDSDDIATWGLDINDYIGKNVKLLFGTYNDALAGVSVMYIDDVALEYCVATSAPEPDSPLPQLIAE
jgi:hypothetical protein